MKRKEEQTSWGAIVFSLILARNAFFMSSLSCVPSFNSILFLKHFKKFVVQNVEGMLRFVEAMLSFVEAMLRNVEATYFSIKKLGRTLTEVKLMRIEFLLLY